MNNLDIKPQNWPDYLKVRVIVRPKSRRILYKRYYTVNEEMKWQYATALIGSLYFPFGPRPRLIVALDCQKDHNPEIFDYVFNKRWKAIIFKTRLNLFHRQCLSKKGGKQW